MKNIKPKQKILLVGKSGSGKNTVQDYLVNKYGLKPLVSYTTRDKRFPEEDTHIFIPIQDFLNKQYDNFIAYTFYNGNHYFATKEQFEESDIYIIDTKGVEYIRKLNITTPYIVVYLDVPADIRAERMAIRNDNSDMISERIKYDETAFDGIEDLCNYSISNYDSEKTADAIAELAGYLPENFDELDTEREIVTKLCQIQTLLRSIDNNIGKVTIELFDCHEIPLKEDNDFSISCLDKDGSKELFAIGTAKNEKGKLLWRTLYNYPNRPHIDIKTTRID